MCQKSTLVVGLLITAILYAYLLLNTIDASSVSPNSTSGNMTTMEPAHSYSLMEISPDEKTLYVVDAGANELVIIDVTKSTSRPHEAMHIQVGSDPRGVAVSVDGKKVYVTNHFDNTVSVINASTNKVIRVIPVGPLPWGLDTSSDGKKLFVANWGDDRYVPIDQKNSISVIDTNKDAIIHTIKLNSTDPGGPFSIRSPSKITEKWIAVTMDAANKLVLINTDTYERKEIDLRKLGSGSNDGNRLQWNPWDLTITNDNRVVIAAGNGPVFFPIIQVSCSGNPGNFSQCAMDTSKKLEFTGQDSINEPWSVYAKGNKIYGVDMYNIAPSGIKQNDGKLLIWNDNNLKLLQSYEHTWNRSNIINPDKVGVGPVDVVSTSGGKIFVSNSGTHELPNKPQEHRGIHVDYSGVAGKASITVSRAISE